MEIKTWDTFHASKKLLLSTELLFRIKLFTLSYDEVIRKTLGNGLCEERPFNIISSLN